MRVPAADIDATQVVAVGHEAGDAADLQFKFVGGNGIAVGRLHFGVDLRPCGAHDALPFGNPRV
ncbi:hypothetical protein D3C81_2190630 [compost metagenome]